MLGELVGLAIVYTLGGLFTPKTPPPFSSTKPRMTEWDWAYLRAYNSRKYGV